MIELRNLTNSTLNISIKNRTIKLLGKRIVQITDEEYRDNFTVIDAFSKKRLIEKIAKANTSVDSPFTPDTWYKPVLKDVKPKRVGLDPEISKTRLISLAVGDNLVVPDLADIDRDTLYAIVKKQYDKNGE